MTFSAPDVQPAVVYNELARFLFAGSVTGLQWHLRTNSKG